MEGCLGASSSGNVSPETVRRWIANVENVLCTSVGKQTFLDFLKNCDGFEQGIQLIQFWEMCHNVVPDEAIVTKQKKKKKRWFSSPKVMDDETLYSKANEILIFANENINLDSGHIQRIDSAIKNANSKDILSSIFEVKKEAVLLLETYHALFKKSLLEQQGLLVSA